MIKLNVMDYCHNCPDFEPDVDKSYYIDGCPITLVRCEDRCRCEAMIEYLQKQSKEDSDE